MRAEVLGSIAFCSDRDAVWRRRQRTSGWAVNCPVHEVMGVNAETTKNRNTVFLDGPSQISKIGCFPPKGNKLARKATAKRVWSCGG